MSKNYLKVTSAQINTKRHWAKAVPRVLQMLAEAEERGSTIVTFNEINKEQAHAILKLPNWNIFWTINDHLPGGSWSGNAVAYRVSDWEADNGFAQPVLIDYRKGLKKYIKMGPWLQKYVNFANIRLTSIKHPEFSISVQAAHYPTKFNSNESSRQRCVDASIDYATRHINKDQAVEIGGDGNGLVPVKSGKGLNIMDREGPDFKVSNGRCVRSVVLNFKKSKLSDHNGLVVTVQYEIV